MEWVAAELPSRPLNKSAVERLLRMASRKSVVAGARLPNESPESTIAFLNTLEHSEEEIRARIDQMDISADTKALLHGFSKATLTMGKSILKVGRKILDVLLAMLREFPHLSFGVIFGFTVGALLAAIPVIGPVLSPVATPLAMLFGVALTFPHELRTGDLGQRIAAVLAEFQPLAG